MADTLRFGLISDTHSLLRNEVYAAFAGVDEILHAGDVGDPAILDELGVIAPVQAVYGNVDGWEVRQQAAEELEFERLDQRIGVIHGHQWGSPRIHDLLGRYPDCSIVVYGHTHQPLIEKVESILVINPGSAGRQRFGMSVTAALLTLKRGRPPEAKLLDLLS